MAYPKPPFYKSLGRCPARMGLGFRLNSHIPKIFPAESVRINSVWSRSINCCWQRYWPHGIPTKIFGCVLVYFSVIWHRFHTLQITAKSTSQNHWTPGMLLRSVRITTSANASAQLEMKNKIWTGFIIDIDNGKQNWKRNLGVTFTLSSALTHCIND